MAIVLATAFWQVSSQERDIRELTVEAESLRLELNRARADNKRLERGCRAVGRAARDQGLIYQNDLDRRERINEVISVCAPSAPNTKGGLIDEETSNRAVALLNSDFFGPLGGGLRGAEGGTGRAPLVSAAASP